MLVSGRVTTKKRGTIVDPTGKSDFEDIRLKYLGTEKSR